MFPRLQGDGRPCLPSPRHLEAELGPAAPAQVPTAAPAPPQAPQAAPLQDRNGRALEADWALPDHVPLPKWGEGYQPGILRCIAAGKEQLAQPAQQAQPVPSVPSPCTGMAALGLTSPASATPEWL